MSFFQNIYWMTPYANNNHDIHKLSFREIIGCPLPITSDNRELSEQKKTREFVWQQSKWNRLFKMIENHPCMMTPCILTWSWSCIHRHTSFSIYIVTFLLMLLFSLFQQIIWKKSSSSSSDGGNNENKYISILFALAFSLTHTHTHARIVVVVAFFSVNINSAELWVAS